MRKFSTLIIALALGTTGSLAQTVISLSQELPAREQFTISPKLPYA